MSYYPAFICENGHAISTLSNICHDRFCTACGTPIISKCPNCQSGIRGKSDEGYAFMIEYKVPAYCPICGKPYPWTIASIEATASLLDVADEVPLADRETLKKLLPDAISQTPRTQLAAAFAKKIADAAGGVIAEGIFQFALNWGCEAFQKFLGIGT